MSFVAFTNKFWPEQVPLRLVKQLRNVGFATPSMQKRREAHKVLGEHDIFACESETSLVKSCSFDRPNMSLEVVDGAEKLWDACFSSLKAERYALDTGNYHEAFPTEAQGEGSDVEDEQSNMSEAGSSDSDENAGDKGPILEEQGAPDKAFLRSLMNMHVNTGHRSLRRLARALTIAGAPRETIRAVRFLKCSVCQEKRKKRTRRPAAIPRARSFNDRVHMDLVQCWDAADKPWW